MYISVSLDIIKRLPDEATLAGNNGIYIYHNKEENIYYKKIMALMF